MLYFILLFWYSFADISQVPFCPTNVYEELKSETPVPGNKACEDAIAQSPNSDRWCECFQWLEPRQIVEDLETDCKTTLDASYSIKDALDICINKECDEVLFETLCRSKHCTWSGSACTDNETCKDQDDLVQEASSALDTPWITDCGMLLAVMEFYHNEDPTISSCDQEITAMIGEIKSIDDSWALDTKLSDLCCQTCHFSKKDAPFIFKNNGCTSHLSCNNGTIPETEIDDFFCADCEQCKSLGDDATCDICSLTSYPANVCIPMKHCTVEKTLEGTACDSIKKNLCKAHEAQVDTIESCAAIYAEDVTNDIIKDNACSCFTDDEFPTPDCVWTYEHLFTLKEEQEFCEKTSCADTKSEYACRSTPHHCVWLPRLVKGECVDHPCYNQANGELVDNECDECQVCEADERGLTSCEFNHAKTDDPCNDMQPLTNKDQCSVEAGKCIGEIATADLLEIKVLGVCQDEGVVYNCADNLLQVELRQGNTCENQTVSHTILQTVDDTCANVITNDAFQKKYYFSGICNETHVTRKLCTKEEYFTRLNQTYTPYENPCEVPYGYFMECGCGQFQILLTLIVLLLVFL